MRERDIERERERYYIYIYIWRDMCYTCAYVAGGAAVLRVSLRYRVTIA